MTAVEYLHYEFMKVFGELQINTSLYYDLVYSLSQAKAMEKEQMISFFTTAYLIGEDNITKEEARKEAEQYYKKTYE